MSHSSPFVCGPVQVTWNADGSVNAITYQSMPLIDAVNQRLNRAGVPGLQALIEDLLDAVAALPPTDRKRKIFLADKIFGVRIVTDPPNPKLQIQVWNAVMPHVWAWEDSHEKVHKGTAYYFMAESYLALGDIPSAYICFFNALEDDKQNFPFISKNLKDAPAYRTTSLIDNPNNALYRSVVVPLRARLQSLIDAYNVRTQSNLTIQILDQKFLQDDHLEVYQKILCCNFP